MGDDRSVLEDIHSVSSLLKMYFRELPNPICTYYLYDKFVEAAKARYRTHSSFELSVMFGMLMIRMKS